MRLKTKVAIVTGTVSGFGRGAALRFAKEGARVAGGDIDVPTDVTRADQVRNLVQQAVERYGGVDILFSNVGVCIGHALVDVSEEEWDRDLLRQHTEAMRANPNIAGYNLVQLSDSNAMEIDGLHDFWRRKRKKSAFAMQEVNQPAVLIVHGSPMNVRAGEEIRLRVTLANEEKLSGRNTLRLRVLSPSGDPVFTREVQADAAPWVTPLFDQRVRLDGPPGRYRLQASFAGLAREDFVTLFAAHAQWPEFTLLDPDGTLAPVLRERRVAFEEWDGQATRPRLIVVTRFSGLYRRREEFIRFLRIFPAVEGGCHAVFLGYPGDCPGLQGVPIINHSFLSQLSMNNIFPFSAIERPERWGQKAGLYTWSLQDPLGGIPVPKHPVYEGLPQTGLMTREYGNVAPISRLETDRDPIEEVGPSLQVFVDHHGRITITYAGVREDAPGRAGRTAAGESAELQRARCRRSCIRRIHTPRRRSRSGSSSTSTVWRRCSGRRRLRPGSAQAQNHGREDQDRSAGQ